MPRVCVLLPLLSCSLCLLMCWIFKIIFSWAPVTTVTMFIKQVSNWRLKSICKLFKPFLFTLFYWKSIIFLHLKVGTLCCVCLILDLSQYIPHIIYYNAWMLRWVRILAWYRDLIEELPCVIFIGCVGFMQMPESGVDIFYILKSVFQECLNSWFIIWINSLNNKPRLVTLISCLN